MNTRRLPSRPGWVHWLLLATLALGLCSTSVSAEDDEDDDFETTWVGLRLGGWYRPAVHLEALVSGRALGLGGSLPGTRFDAESDLGVTQTVESEVFPDQVVPEAQFFFDTEWVSLSLDFTAPYRYRGRRVFQRTINFAGRSFTAGVAVDSKLEQFSAGVQLKINVFNNRVFAISPLIGARMFALDWELEASTVGGLPGGALRADTTEIDNPIQFGDFQVLPYPELGLEVKVGLRKFFEVDAKLSGFYLDFFGLRGGALNAELGATLFPIPNLGIRLAYRYQSIDFQARHSKQSSNFFEFDLNFHGPTLSLIVRF